MALLKVELFESKQTRVGFSTGALLSLAKKIIRDHQKIFKKRGAVSLELIWVSDNQIKKLNKQYRKKNQATDVLSFSYLDSFDQDGLIGQIIISTQTLRKQARQQNHAYRIEAEILFTHGVLHVLGYDHESKKDFARMMSAEQKYLGDNSGLVHRSGLE